MKRSVLIFLGLFCFVVVAMSDPVLNKIADFTLSPNYQIEVYQGNVRTISWTLKNNGAVVNGTNYQPVFYFFDKTRCITGACAWTTMTAGVFTATLSISNLSTSGKYTYGVGMSNSVGVTTAQQGKFKISREH
jgi:hypothetical protein